MIVGKAKEYFESKGIPPSRIFIAILTFKVTTYANWFGTLYLCYRFNPIKTMFTKLKGPKLFHEYIKKRYSVRYNKTQDYINKKAQHLAEWRYFRPIPNFLGVDPQRFTLALAENIILYKLSLTITVPLQAWLIINTLKQKNGSIELHINKEEENNTSNN